MESSRTAELDIPELNAAASKAHVFPGITNQSLLSVGQLCNEGYIITFKQAAVAICDPDNSQISSGPRDSNNGLWCINLKHINSHIPRPYQIMYMNYITQELYYTTCTKPYSVQQNLQCYKRSTRDICSLGPAWRRTLSTNIRN
jgi:hypothetical protein